MSKPHVITLANVEAVLDNTETFFVRVEGEEEVDLFNVSVGTTLRVTPHVFEDAGRTHIKLLVNIEDGSTSDQRVDDIPIIDRSSINTQALISEGQSLLIGGLVRETTQNSVSKVPLLGDIPVLGGLFRTNRKSSVQAERLFLLTPRLTSTPTSAVEGKRFDGPVLSGTESDILETAPSRLETARSGLDARDERYPPPKRLPQGQGTPRLTTSEPSRQAEKAPGTSDGEDQVRTRLADRLKMLQEVGTPAQGPAERQAQVQQRATDQAQTQGQRPTRTESSDDELLSRPATVDETSPGARARRPAISNTLEMVSEPDNGGWTPMPDSVPK